METLTDAPAEGRSRGARTVALICPESTSCNIGGIWRNLSAALIRFVAARLLISTHFHAPVKFLRSRLKASSFPCGSIRRIIVLLETTQLFNDQDLSPRSFLSPPPFFFCLSFLFSETFPRKSRLALTRNDARKEQRVRLYWRENIRLEKAFQNNLRPHQMAAG